MPGTNMEGKGPDALSCVSASSAQQEGPRWKKKLSPIERSQRSSASTGPESITTRHSAVIAEPHKGKSLTHAASKNKTLDGFTSFSSRSSRQGEELPSRKSSPAQKAQLPSLVKVRLSSDVQSTIASAEQPHSCVPGAGACQRQVASRSQAGEWPVGWSKTPQRRLDASHSQVQPVESTQLKARPLAACSKPPRSRKETGQQVRCGRSQSAQRTARNSAWHAPLVATQDSSANPTPGDESIDKIPFSDFLLQMTSHKAPRPDPNSQNRAWDPRDSDPSVDPSGYQFLPRFTDGWVRLPGDMADRLPRSGNLPTNLGIGIESEFYLASRRPSSNVTSVKTFGALMARDHNLFIPASFPRMYSDLEEQDFYLTKSTTTAGAQTNPLPTAPVKEPGQPQNWPTPKGLDEWTLAFDTTMYTHGAPFGIEMKSPIFVSFPGSPWRSRLLKTWDYLNSQFYITKSERCATHIHISVQHGYDLDDLKQIAKAAFYFEPAFDALVPPHRRGDCNEWAQNLWLGPLDIEIDRMSRLKLLKSIDDTTNFDTFLKMINPLGRFHSWNFCSIPKYYTVELRKPPACTTAKEALGWAEIAMAFVQSSLQRGIEDVLYSLPSNVGGLRSFLERSCVQGVNEHERLETIFQGIDPNLAMPATPNFGRLATFAYIDVSQGDATISMPIPEKIHHIQRDILELLRPQGPRPQE